MELIYTDKDLNDAGILDPTAADFAWGASENDFEITLSSPPFPQTGALVYSEGTDLGGIVTGYESISTSSSITLRGSTWTGVLGRKIVIPDAGAAYLTLSGDVRDMAQQLITRLGLSSLFYVEPAKTGIVTSHTFTGRRSDSTQQDAGRYMDGWAAMWQLLSEHGCKVKMTWDYDLRRVSLKIMRLENYTNSEGLQVGAAKVKVTADSAVNHLICLGKGELAQRSRADVYLDKAGRASKTQYFFGLDEIAAIYEDTQKEGTELVSSGLAKIKSLADASQKVEVSASSVTQYDLGDVVGGLDPTSGVFATAIVSKKIAKLKKGLVSYEYSTSMR